MDYPSRHARTWGMACHLASFAQFIIPFGGVLGPLVVWLLRKDDHSFIDDQGKESLNFQMSLSSAQFVLLLLARWQNGGYFLFGMLTLAGVVFAIIASIKANEGVAYRYPLSYRFLR